MGSLLNKSIKRGESLIALAEVMHQKCTKRKRKRKSYYRIVLSFFFSRSWEMYKSLILLIKGKKIIDAAILVRSLCNLAIDLAYITRDSNKKEVISIKYCIEGDKAQIKIIKANKDDFRDLDSKIDLRLEALKKNVEKLKNYFSLKYPNEASLSYPRLIIQRAKKVGGYILKLYNMVYKGYSNIEHHNMFFGQDYVNFTKSEPILSPEKFEKSDIYRPEFLLYLHEWIFLMIMMYFNGEYRLNFRKELSDRIKIHKKAFEDLKKIRQSTTV